MATGDFTSNGLPDIVATNIGLNSPYKMRDGKPIRIYYDDLNRDGHLDLVEAYYDREVESYVPRRRLYDFGSVPTILRNVQNHAQFAEATPDEIFDRDFNEISYKEIDTPEHMVFINNKDGFEAHPLPTGAQFTAGFDAGVADVDNDGKEDLFLSQIFFAFPKHIPRLDAGRGLLLKGDGNGNFIPINGIESGIEIYGEQRGAAFGDVNTDGKVDLVVAQNNEQTKLYLNQTKKKGVRVQLAGPESNLDAVGSSIRIVYSDGSKGPRREVQAGSGYWSQGSLAQVLGWNSDKEPSGIEVNWFGRRMETVQIPGSMINDDLLIVYPDSLISH